MSMVRPAPKRSIDLCATETMRLFSKHAIFFRFQEISSLHRFPGEKSNCCTGEQQDSGDRKSVV